MTWKGAIFFQGKTSRFQFNKIHVSPDGEGIELRIVHRYFLSCTVIGQKKGLCYGNETCFVYISHVTQSLYKIDGPHDWCSPPRSIFPTTSGIDDLWVNVRVIECLRMKSHIVLSLLFPIPIKLCCSYPESFWRYSLSENSAKKLSTGLTFTNPLEFTTLQFVSMTNSLGNGKLQIKELHSPWMTMDRAV